MLDLNKIRNTRELAYALGVPLKHLTYLLYAVNSEDKYTTFEIPKKSGGPRKICAPHKELKVLQSELANLIQKHMQQDNLKMYFNHSHAFQKEKSIFSNAQIHCHKKYVYNIDLENYFDSFHFGRITGYFQKNKDLKLPEKVANMIAQLSCYKGTLPQGAPSSPAITNLIGNILDIRLLKLAAKYKLNYTRYADDITFSTNDKYFCKNTNIFLEKLSQEIKLAGFALNEKKTRFLYHTSRQEVTGLVVNQRLNIKREFYKNTRAMAEHLYQEGFFTINGVNGSIKQLEGRFAYINQIEKVYNIISGCVHPITKLNGKERQYQKFLFYKYFYANEKPLIVTEGKTDVLYLKAALKKYHSEYPELIELDENGRFVYKISFFKRSKRLRYFFAISLDGADSMENIWYAYTGKKNNFPQYANIFEQYKRELPNFPVILLYDNELNGNKPLKKILDKMDNTSEIKDTISTNFYTNIIKNLYIATMPLPKDKAECEIEDLLGQEIIAHEIDGKIFNRDANYNKATEYGKNILSQYVYMHYKNLDLDGIKKILDILSEIIRTYQS